MLSYRSRCEFVGTGWRIVSMVSILFAEQYYFLTTDLGTILEYTSCLNLECVECNLDEK